MMLSRWEDLPEFLRVPEVKPYHAALCRCRAALRWKRGLDVAVSAALLAGLSPVLCAAAAAVKLDDPHAPVLFRQERVTQNGRTFQICKFRTMRPGADRAGPQVTARDDRRVTPVGKVLRRCKLDELPQLWNVLTGEMTLVGARPEVPRYVARYTPEMRATLLLPAGVTSAASLRFRDEERLLAESRGPVERIYLQVLLPEKMRDNLDYLRRYRFSEDLRLLGRTLVPPVRRRSSSAKQTAENPRRNLHKPLPPGAH